MTEKNNIKNLVYNIILLLLLSKEKKMLLLIFSCQNSLFKFELWIL